MSYDYEDHHEFNVFERVGLPGLYNDSLAFQTDIHGNKELQNIVKNISRIRRSPEEKFLLILNAVFYSVRDTLPSIHLDERLDLSVIMEQAYNTPNIQYKNPTAFIYGYIVTNNQTKEIDRKKLNIIFNYIANDPDITEPDIIRYARLWMTF